MEKLRSRQRAIRKTASVATMRFSRRVVGSGP
jgi:hypothetical protein